MAKSKTFWLKIAALWKGKNKGTMSGKLDRKALAYALKNWVDEDDSKEADIFMYLSKNDNKEKDNQPDYNIIVPFDAFDHRDAIFDHMGWGSDNKPKAKPKPAADDDDDDSLPF